MLEIAQQQLLAPAGLELHHLDKVLDHLLSHQVDLADIYFQTSRLEAWTLEDGIVKEGSYNIEQGAGIRAISGEKTGFAYTDELFLPNLIEAADTARAIARSGQRATQITQTTPRAEMASKTASISGCCMILPRRLRPTPRAGGRVRSPCRWRNSAVRLYSGLRCWY